MKILVIPRAKRNPYQEILYSLLEKYGLNIKMSSGYSVDLVLPLFKEIKKTWKPDILHIHWQHPFILGNNRMKSVFKSVQFLAELSIVRLLGVKVVWTVHELTIYGKKYQRLELFVIGIMVRLVDRILVHTQKTKDFIVSSYNINGNMVSVIPHANYKNYYSNNTSRKESRVKFNIDDEDIVYLFFGMIRDYKGLPELIGFFKEIQSHNTKLIIAGRPFRKDIARNIMRDCAGNENITTFLEYIPDEDVQFFMNAADVVVLPFKGILTSGSVMLSLTFGKPVIAPAIGDLPEVLDESGSFLYDPTVKDGLLAAIKAALNADLVSMGRHNKELGKRYDADNTVLKTLRMYNEIMKS